jgi:hypothetical protein
MAKPEGVKLEYCPNCKKRSLFWNQTKQLWECLNTGCRLKYTSQEFSEYWYNQYKQQSKESTQGRVSPKAKQISFSAPLWLVNILESKRFWKLLICSAVVWWCWTAIQYSGNSIGLAFGLAVPILLLYAVKIILRRFLSDYKTLASQHQLSRVFYLIRKSPFLRFAIILATIALLVTTIWGMTGFVYRLITSPSPVYLLNMLVLIIAQIWLLSWLCGTLKHSRQLSSKPRFAVVFWSLFAVAVFCAFVGIRPFSDAKAIVLTSTKSAIISITEWWGHQQEQTTATIEPPSGSTTEPPAENQSPSPSINTSQGITNFYNVQPPYAKTFGGVSIHLMNNQNSLDPTWQQLLLFLNNDATDKKSYDLVSFPCGAFAEEVHNNAEAAGIKAAWVAVDFADSSDEHALNAFNTTDEGLVFVDCTGECCSSLIPSGFGSKTYGSANSWDKIAYVEVGEEYGLITANVASSPDYSCYLQYHAQKEQFERELDSYNIEVQQYNQWVTGRTFYAGSADYLRAKQWEQKLRSEAANLDKIGTSLGAFWEPFGIVSKIKIYW